MTAPVKGRMSPDTNRQSICRSIGSAGRSVGHPDKAEAALPHSIGDTRSAGLPAEDREVYKLAARVLGAVDGKGVGAGFCVLAERF